MKCEVDDCYGEATTKKRVPHLDKHGRTIAYEDREVCDDHAVRDVWVQRVRSQVTSVVGGFETGKRR